MTMGDGIKTVAAQTNAALEAELESESDVEAECPHCGG